jgi:hypothetical protein
MTSSTKLINHTQQGFFFFLVAFLWALILKQNQISWRKKSVCNLEDSSMGTKSLTSYLQTHLKHTSPSGLCILHLWRQKLLTSPNKPCCTFTFQEGLNQYPIPRPTAEIWGENAILVLDWTLHGSWFTMGDLPCIHLYSHSSPAFNLLLAMGRMSA